MNTWTSRGAIALAALITLTGCDEAALQLGAGRTAAQVTQTQLAGGAIALTAPAGYCIDTRSVRRGRNSSFAVLARCDTLGVKGFFAAQDLALITVTTQANADGTRPDMESIAAARPKARVTARRTIRKTPFVRLSDNSHSVKGASAEHWRSAFVLNGHTVALALYASEDSPALGPDGAELLAGLVRATRSASQAKTKSDQ